MLKKVAQKSFYLNFILLTPVIFFTSIATTLPNWEEQGILSPSSKVNATDSNKESRLPVLMRDENLVSVNRLFENFPKEDSFILVGWSEDRPMRLGIIPYSRMVELIKRETTPYDKALRTPGVPPPLAAAIIMAGLELPMILSKHLSIFYVGEENREIIKQIQPIVASVVDELAIHLGAEQKRDLIHAVSLAALASIRQRSIDFIAKGEKPLCQMSRTLLILAKKEKWSAIKDAIRNIVSMTGQSLNLMKEEWGIQSNFYIESHLVVSNEGGYDRMPSDIFYRRHSWEEVLTENYTRLFKEKIAAVEWLPGYFADYLAETLIIGYERPPPIDF